MKSQPFKESSFLLDRLVTNARLFAEAETFFPTLQTNMEVVRKGNISLAKTRNILEKIMSETISSFLLFIPLLE